MKLLLVLMLVLSLIVGLPISGNWSFLYQYEFPAMIELFKTGELSPSKLILWIVLLIAHLGLISLLFLTQKSYFRTLLIVIPLLFILIYMVWSLLLSFLLIPFVVVWIVALAIQNKTAALR